MRLLPIACLLAAAPIQAQDISFDAPTGGWRHSRGETVDYTQPVSYPAVAVSVPAGQSRAGFIAGRVKAATKDRRPATLVVNGVAMPQRVDADGRFSRPYSFGAGSNSLAVHMPEGKSARLQFYEAYTGRSPARLRVILSWDSDATDLDLHVLTPDGGHAFYGDRVLANGGALDVDVTTGYGPEIFSMPAPQPGIYHVYVNYYGAGDRLDDLTVAQVTIIGNEGTPDEKRQAFRVPLRKPGELTLIRSFVYP